MFVYWCENVVIGLFNAVRVAMAQGTHDKQGSPLDAFGKWFLRLFMVPFFLVHYGGFCFGHVAFLAVMCPPGGGRPTGDRDLDEVLLEVASDPVFMLVVAALSG